MRTHDVGAGLPYHLFRTRDPILWMTFVVGDINFLAAIAAVIFLVRQRPAARSSAAM